MTKYASKECRFCSAVYPANNMIRVSESVNTGHSSASGLVLFEKNGAQRYINSHRNYYRNTNFFLCPPCHQVWRKRRLIRRIFYLVVLGAISFAAYGLFTGSTTPDASALSSPPVVSQPDSTFLDNYGNDHSDEATTYDNDVETPPTTIVSAGQEFDPSNDRTEAAAQGEELPAQSSAIIGLDRSVAQNLERNSAIATARTRALTEGATHRWKSGLERGYVVVSDPQQSADGECRNVLVTLIDGEHQTSLAPEKWCRASSGDWLIVN